MKGKKTIPMQNVINHFVDTLILTRMTKYISGAHYSDGCLLGTWNTLKNRSNMSRKLQSKIYADFTKFLANMPVTLPKL